VQSAGIALDPEAPYLVVTAGDPRLLSELAALRRQAGRADRLCNAVLDAGVYQPWKVTIRQPNLAWCSR
jgi:hypothetical protein